MELFHARNVPYIWSSKFNNTFSQKPEIWLGVNWQDVPKTVLQRLNIMAILTVTAACCTFCHVCWGFNIQMNHIHGVMVNMLTSSEVQ